MKRIFPYFDDKFSFKKSSSGEFLNGKGKLEDR